MDQPPIIQPAPPPLQPLPPSKPKPSFARQAAVFSVWAPIVAIFINMAVTGASIRSGPGMQSQTVLMAFAGTFIILLGFVLGIVALCTVKPDDRKGVVGRAIAGLLLNGFLITMGVLGFMAAKNMKARQRRPRVEFNHPADRMPATAVQVGKAVGSPWPAQRTIHASCCEPGTPG